MPGDLPPGRTPLLRDILVFQHQRRIPPQPDNLEIQAGTDTQRLTHIKTVTLLRQTGPVKITDHQIGRAHGLVFVHPAELHGCSRIARKVMLIGLPPTGKAEIIQQQTAVAVVLRKTPHHLTELGVHAVNRCFHIRFATEMVRYRRIILRQLRQETVTSRQEE